MCVRAKMDREKTKSFISVLFQTSCQVEAYQSFGKSFDGFSNQHQTLQ